MDDIGIEVIFSRYKEHVFHIYKEHIGQEITNQTTGNAALPNSAASRPGTAEVEKEK